MKTEKHVVILWLIISLLLPTLACAQYKFDNVLYGAAYYHEYMPTDRLDKDIQMMKIVDFQLFVSENHRGACLNLVKASLNSHGWIG